MSSRIKICEGELHSWEYEKQMAPGLKNYCSPPPHRYPFFVATFVAAFVESQPTHDTKLPNPPAGQQKPMTFCHHLHPRS
jgi:hypothetical protein